MQPIGEILIYAYILNRFRIITKSGEEPVIRTTGLWQLD